MCPPPPAPTSPVAPATSPEAESWAMPPSPPELRPLQLESLQESDLNLVWETEKRAHAHPWSLGNFRDSLQSGYPAHLLVSPPRPGEATTALTASGQVLLGYLVAMKGVDEVHLLNITVAPEHRRQGWARVMMQALAAWATADGADCLWLEVRAHNEPALALYRGFGFVTMGLRKGYYPAGRHTREDALVMSLPLRAPLPLPTAP